MLEVQKFLQTKTHDQLAEELGIKVVRHESRPLVILNYNQIDSPKTHPVVRECRGLVLHAETNEIVARSFPRFFNWGEVADEMNDFDFSDFTVQSKEDGSLVLLYCFEGEWRVNTRGSFAEDPMQFQEFTWTEGVCRALGIDLDMLKRHLVEDVTYVCEFVSPWNKIVRTYKEPQLYLLTAFKGLDELKYKTVDDFSSMIKLFMRPRRYEFHSIEDIQAFLREQEQADPTFEGVVIRDSSNRRWKVKSATYLGLHRLKGEGENMYNPKHLLPFILAGEEGELLTYFPEISEAFYKLKSKVLGMYSQLLEVWADHKDIEEQKEFALAIQGKTPFTGILFNLRKLNERQRAEHLRAAWRDAERMILNNLG